MKLSSTLSLIEKTTYSTNGTLKFCSTIRKIGSLGRLDNFKSWVSIESFSENYSYLIQRVY